MDFSAIENFGPAAPSEDGVSARFYDRSQKTDKIDAYGFPVFENVCFCEIRIKDNNSEIFDQPATADKIRRFPQEYARYQLHAFGAVCFFDVIGNRSAEMPRHSDGGGFGRAV